MVVNEQGIVIRECWFSIPSHFSNVELDEFIIMPNHIHGVIIITTYVGARHAVPLQIEQFGKPVRGSIPTIVCSFKSAVTKQINELRQTPSIPVWQRNYYEHVIRNEIKLNNIREYIRDNPVNWQFDEYYV